MRGKGIMRGLSQPKSCSSKKTLKRCNTKGKFKNVDFIDVDGDRVDNVIIIDAPESQEKDLLQGSSGSEEGKQFPSVSVISIDDDESDNTDDPQIRVEQGDDLDNDASRKNSPAPYLMQKSPRLDDDDCQFIKVKKSTYKLSKCKKTYTGKTSCGKRFGLSPESEDSSSGNDSSDCELMEDSVELQEKWEKAFRRKRYNVGNGQSGLKDERSASGMRNHTPPRVEEENSTQHDAETPAYSGSSDSNTQKQNSSAFETYSHKYFGGTCLNRGTEKPFVESDKKVDHERFAQSKDGPTAELQCSHVQADVIFRRERFMKDSISRDGNQEFPWEPTNCDPYPGDLQHEKMVPNGKQKLQPEELSMSIHKLSEENLVGDGMASSDFAVETVFDELTSVKIPLGGMPVFGCENNFDREKVVPGGYSPNDKGQVEQSFSKADQSSSKNNDEMDTLHVQGVDSTVYGEKDIITDREKLKDTDEYKRAVEEEWASRHRELKIQAEEAQRLRKRRKAESMHLLDMEKRQKQRLEEMRETQKKDEENMNLKEQLRSEVRKELAKLEISCIDLASLLRSLGIPVVGGFRPMSNEINAAYKRALLKFHPDRSSKTDIRQQVEAEEKFKLISRMKEKFLATSLALRRRAALAVALVCVVASMFFLQKKGPRKKKTAIACREMVKETDVYKSAEEKEGQYMQRQLKIDQNEKNMKLKEQLRIEVIKELTKLEISGYTITSCFGVWDFQYTVVSILRPLRLFTNKD